MLTHIINEAKSDPDAVVWTMWCGDQCIALDDGTLIPMLDFYHENVGHKADCETCKRAMKLRAAPRVAEVVT